MFCSIHYGDRLLSEGGRVVFNIKANDFRLVSLVQYADGVVMIRFFGSHDEYDKIDAENI
jgi:mRNA interferase HigB